MTLSPLLHATLIAAILIGLLLISPIYMGSYECAEDGVSFVVNHDTDQCAYYVKSCGLPADMPSGWSVQVIQGLSNAQGSSKGTVYRDMCASMGYTYLDQDVAPLSDRLSGSYDSYEGRMLFLGALAFGIAVISIGAYAVSLVYKHSVTSKISTKNLKQ